MHPSTLQDHPTDPLQSSARLRDLLDTRGVEEILASFYALFRIPLRILDDAGDTLARTRQASPLNEYLGQLPEAGQRLAAEHELLRTREPDESGEFSYTAFTGATYHVALIGHDGRRVGRFVLGPFLTPLVRELPATLTHVDPGLDDARAAELLFAMPRVRQDTVKAIARHLSVTLDVLIFAGHRALLSEHMHLSTVRENQRQLSAKDAGLLEAEQRLLHSGRVQAHFLGTALGELRGPLESIIGQSDALASGGRLQAEQGEVVLGIRQRAAQLLGLSDRLLDFSKADSGSLSLRREAIDLPALLAHVASRLRACAPERAGDLAVVCEPGLPPLWADAGCIEQILTLLAENALRFAPRGEIGIEARRATGSAGDEADAMVLLGAPPELIELRVSDRGVGIADEEKERIFEPFYQGPRRARGPGEPLRGNGLGLALAKRLTMAHGGTIRVEDNTPCGTSVIVTLPASPPAGML